MTLRDRSNNISTALRHRFRVIAGVTAVALNLPAVAQAQSNIGEFIRYAFSPNIHEAKQRADSGNAHMVNTQYDQYTPPDARVPHTDRWARVGPYDRWAIAWAYRPIPRATSSEAELPTLEQWRSAQDTAAYLRVSVDGPGGDHNTAGGDDPVRAIEFRARDRVAVWHRLFLDDTAATLAAASPKLPAQARPEAYRDLAAATRTLARAASTASSPSAKAAATALRTALTPALKICRD
jgi:hypothetical protein